jgi:ATP-binding cassette subfamily B (MDR/TAP) protein 1
MTEQGYSRCHFYHCVYFKRLENGSYIILLLYVDDMLVAGSNMQDINVLKKKLANSFAMKDLGAAPWHENNKRQKKSQINIVSE